MAKDYSGVRNQGGEGKEWLRDCMNDDLNDRRIRFPMRCLTRHNGRY